MKFPLKAAGEYALEEARKAELAELAKTAPGPPITPCDECGKPHRYATGDFGKPSDTAFYYCESCAPHALRYAAAEFAAGRYPEA